MSDSHYFTETYVVGKDWQQIIKLGFVLKLPLPVGDYWVITGSCLYRPCEQNYQQRPP